MPAEGTLEPEETPRPEHINDHLRAERERFAEITRHRRFADPRAIGDRNLHEVEATGDGEHHKLEPKLG